MSTAKGVWVFTEAQKDEFKKNSLEVICAGRGLANRLGEELCALLLGHKVEHLADIPSHYGADKVYLGEDELLSYYNIDSHVAVVTNLIKELAPRIVLFGATPMGRELAPRVAARLKVGLITECVELKINEQGLLIMRKGVHGGKAQATFVCSPITPQMATLAPGVVDIKGRDEKRKGEVVRITPGVEGKPSCVEFIRFIKGDPKTISITESEIIIAVGRGLGKAEHLHIIDELADLLGASIGGSRGAVDAGWIPQERQIGMTGKTVSPRLFISCGISGQYPHTVGMEGSGAIIAINTDRNAPVFKIADLGVLGDLSEVVPAIQRLIKESAVSV